MIYHFIFTTSFTKQRGIIAPVGGAECIIRIDIFTAEMKHLTEL